MAGSGASCARGGCRHLERTATSEGSKNVASINRVVIVGTDGEIPRFRPAQLDVVESGVAATIATRIETYEWVEERMIFNVVVFGAEGDACAEYLTKGRPVAVDGRLRWSSWEENGGGSARRWTSSPTWSSSSARGSGQRLRTRARRRTRVPMASRRGFDVPADTSHFGQPAGRRQQPGSSHPVLGSTPEPPSLVSIRPGFRPGSRSAGRRALEVLVRIIPRRP